MIMQENIITIRKCDSSLANEAFADFMKKTESELNDRANKDSKFFKSLNSSQLEVVSVNCIKDIAPSTPFRPEEIKLVAGTSFPDIVAETYYGIEVKSTKSNHWKSTGSSIMETTRNKNIENIYMLFGKLGGKPAFRCRPYEDCLYDITVTHSPRYLIDMETKKDDTIFSKMHTTYDELRTSKDSIAQVRRYYRDKVRQENKGEMPWWLNEVEEGANNLMITHISYLDPQRKNRIIEQLYTLFPQNMICGDYKEPAMWLVAYHKVVSHNMRDNFSAGGQAKYLNGKPLQYPIPAIVKRFLDYAPAIKEHIKEMYAEIDVFNPALLESKNPFNSWVAQVDSLFTKKFGNIVHFAEWIRNGDKLTI